MALREGVLKATGGGASGAGISSWTPLRLLGITVKFQTSSTFWLQPVWSPCSCHQHVSSGGGLIPVEMT